MRALPGAQSTKYEYNAAGLRTRMLDTEDNVWSYVYDRAGRLIEADDPDGGTTITEYDEFDRVATRTNGNGEKVAYSYDGIGRPLALRNDSPSDDSIRIQWEYDQAKLPDNGDGSLTRFPGRFLCVDHAAISAAV